MNYKTGVEIKPFEIEIDKYRSYYYAGASGDFNSIHLDDEFAKKVGLGGKILHGLCTMAYVYRAIVQNEDPQKVKKIKVRFRNVVRPLDKLTIEGKVAKEENNLFTIEANAENQKGEQVITNGLIEIEK
ncbi:MAG: hypothetical protein A3B68_01415 [Candidatus Melainabacteria bacterium RIFCSPHIGHO2_02_FULL_34_12]|nr:MAG: hypothetical protein A3B68_01415 [Candidatus Melainabacteria bacterium RIFCSPHIGHO2_02_FULL_34_12]